MVSDSTYRFQMPQNQNSICVDNKLYGQFQNFEFKCSQYNPPLHRPATASQATVQSVALDNASTNQWLLNIFYINARSTVNKLHQIQS